MVERKFKAADRNGTVCDFELKPPGLAEENEGERQYRIAYSKSLVEGIFPREKLREVMRDHGMWTEEDDAELKKAVGNIAVHQIELRNAETEGDDKTCESAAQTIAEARRRMWELFLVQQSVYMNSAEGVAEMIKTEAIMATCTHVQATGKPYWKDYAEYVRERDLNPKSTVYAHVIEIQSKILDSAREGLMEDYPEYSYLKSAEERVLDREVEEEVVKELRSRADKAIAKDKKPVKKKKVSRKKKVGKREKGVETKTDTTG
jgi:hypothetical protein